jgi:hypothetical protein
MLAQMQPYTPSLYEPDGYGRYRQYPRNVDTPIPGAGYNVGEMVWAEQELNLDGNASPQPYGDYAKVPLRGMGDLVPASMLTSRSLVTMSVAPPVGPSAETAADEVFQPLSPAPLEPQSRPFFEYGSPSFWALVAGGVAVVGGGAWWFLKKK